MAKKNFASLMNGIMGDSKPIVSEVPPEVLVLAGDIGYLGDDIYQKHPFWAWASENFKQVIVVPCNHELYKFFDINDLREGIILKVRPNVTVFYNNVIPLDNETVLIVSTLWSHIPPAESYLTERCVSDFARIRNGKYRLSAHRFNEERPRCRQFIEKAVDKSKASKIIVATHHVPSFELMSL